VPDLYATGLVPRQPYFAHEDGWYRVTIPGVPRVDEPAPSVHAPDSDHPDLGGAVGPSHVVDFVGSSFTVRDKVSGAVLQQMTQDQFWQQAGLTTGMLNDPRLVYDPLASRWYAVTAGPYDFLAVSAGPDPTHAWKGVTLTTAISGDLLARVGFDVNGVYICSYDVSLDSICFAIPKGDVAWSGSASPSLSRMATFAGLPFELVPAIDLDPRKAAGAPELLLTRMGGQNATALPFTLQVVRITWSAGSASASPVQTIATQLSYTTPADAVQPGSGSPSIKTREDHRFFDVFAFGGSIFAAQGTQIGTHVGVNWIELGAADGALAQQGTLCDPGADLLFPSVAVDGQGSLAIAFGRVSTSEAPSVYVAARLASDPPGTLRAPVLLERGSSPYSCSSNPVGWGTYSSMMRDPSDASVLWSYQQYGNSSASCAWSTVWNALSL
jgi:hypothetical protein